VFPDGIDVTVAEALKETSDRTAAATPAVDQRTEEELVTT
jgi:hypothetical protein